MYAFMFEMSLTFKNLLNYKQNIVTNKRTAILFRYNTVISLLKKI